MKHIPFVAFPPAEQNALLAVLRQGGVVPGEVCASRVEWTGLEAGGDVLGFTMVTAPGLTRTYPDGIDRCWLSALEQDLARR